MRPRIVSYVFRVWLTSIAAGPILFILGANLMFWFRYNFLTNTSRFPGHESVSWPTLAEVGVFYIGGFLGMLPTLLLLWLGCLFVCRRIWPLRLRKLAVVIWALLSIAATSIVLGVRLGWGWQPISFLSGGFFLPLLFGILFYRFPEPRADPVFDF